MKLDDNYTLESSEQQWTLKYENKYFDEKQQKEVTTKNEYFFSTISGALNSYVDKKLKVAETVDEAVVGLLDSLIRIRKNGFVVNDKN